MLESKAPSIEENHNTDLTISEFFQSLFIRFENISPPIRLLIVFPLVVMVGIGGYFVSNKVDSSTESIEKSIPFAQSSTGSTVKIDVNSEKIKVHIVGEVQTPGILEIESNSRVSEVINKAGGATLDADVEQLNLAAFVSDGSQIRVPKKGDDIVGPLVIGSSSGDGNTNSKNVVNVNRATADDLETLTGVGPSLASKIIKYRDSNGSFDSVDSLLSVPGIGPAKLESMRDFVAL